jgi:hypothetical protein
MGVLAATPPPAEGAAAGTLHRARPCVAAWSSRKSSPCAGDDRGSGLDAAPPGCRRRHARSSRTARSSVSSSSAGQGASAGRRRRVGAARRFMPRDAPLELEPMLRHRRAERRDSRSIGGAREARHDRPTAESVPGTPEGSARLRRGRLGLVDRHCSLARDHGSVAVGGGVKMREINRRDAESIPRSALTAGNQVESERVGPGHV